MSYRTMHTLIPCSLSAQKQHYTHEHAFGRSPYHVYQARAQAQPTQTSTQGMLRLPVGTQGIAHHMSFSRSLPAGPAEMHRSEQHEGEAEHGDEDGAIGSSPWSRRNHVYRL